MYSLRYNLPQIRLGTELVLVLAKTNLINSFYFIKLRIWIYEVGVLKGTESEGTCVDLFQSKSIYFHK